MGKKKKTDLHQAIYQEKPWDDNQNNIWLASTLSLERNIDHFPFPGKLNSMGRNQIVSLVEPLFLELPQLQNAVFLKTEELDPLKRKYLAEHFLAFHGFQHLHSGEAFAIDSTGLFLAAINLDNHLFFEVIDSQGDLEGSWNRLVQIEMQLGESLNYAFSAQFGFLTTDPASSGTAFCLGLFLQPSALIHSGRIDDVLDKITSDKLIISGMHGNPQEVIGDILLVRNHFTLGVTEEQILSTARLFTAKLLVEERSCRSELRQKDNSEVKDRVSRAFGILNHSYQIETTEALNAIGLLKLGADIGWLKGISPGALNQLFFNCRRAHLLHILGREVPKEEIAHRRAEYIHGKLQGVELTC